MLGLIQTFIRCSKTVTIAYTRKEKKATKNNIQTYRGYTTYTLLETIQCKKRKNATVELQKLTTNNRLPYFS